MAVLFVIMRGAKPPRPTTDDCHGYAMSEELWLLADDCWEPNPEDRPEMTNITGRLKHFHDCWEPSREHTLETTGTQQGFCELDSSLAVAPVLSPPKFDGVPRVSLPLPLSLSPNKIFWVLSNINTAFARFPDAWKAQAKIIIHGG
jgi:hypothetical protein